MLTIFTPTYNRAYTLTRLFESLKKQSNKEFEWIIIDDDSKDNTNELINRFLSEKCGFEIVYKKQQHGGKHRAFNKAVKIAKGDWFFCVDSDDYLNDEAIEKIYLWIEKNKDNRKVGTISGSRFDTEHKKALSVSEFLLDNPGFKCLNYKRHLYGLDSDRAEIYRTELLRLHPFPEFENEYFITENVCWDRIALDGYYTVFYPDVIYFNEYLCDGLTKGGANGYKGALENFYGFLAYINIEFQCYGVCEKIYPILLMMLKIANKKNISLIEIEKQTGISVTKLKKIRKNKIKLFIFRIFRKLQKALIQEVCR